jgi:hypothetical protein
MKENLNYPIPDPAWDYAPLWENLQRFKFNFDKLLEDIADIEESTDLSDREIATKLADAISSLQAAYKSILHP